MPTRKPPPPPPPPPNGAISSAPSPVGTQASPRKQHSHHKKGSLNLKPTKFFRRVRSAFKSLPIMSAPCKMPMPMPRDGHHIHGGKQTTGTLFGYRKSRVNLAIQENSRSFPMLILELSINTGKLLHDMGLGMVRIALECEKHHPLEKIKLVDEPIWTLYCNGRKAGYAAKREPTDDDRHVIQVLQAVSMGAGVIPADHARNSAPVDSGGLTYLRACFERMIGSKDSETYYMVNIDSNSGPELSIFFVRV